MNELTQFLPIEKSMIEHAQKFANMSGKSWEVFRDGRGAVDLALSGTCEQESKFRFIAKIDPQHEVKS